MDLDDLSDFPDFEDLPLEELEELDELEEEDVEYFLEDFSGSAESSIRGMSSVMITSSVFFG